jgi:sortase A
MTLESLSGTYRYRADSIRVVDPGETRVLDNSDDAILTLVTCYPFSFVGPAPKRFVVRAHKLSATATGPASADVMARGMR